MRKSFLFPFLLALLSVGIAAQERFVRPVDEGKLDPSFVTFRARLIAATERRDAAYIKKILDPEIQLSFGGDSGLADFRRIWKIEKKDSEFWETFLPVIKNGGTFFRNSNGRISNVFYAPYSFQAFPEDLDPFEHCVIFGSNVKLRAAPSLKAEVKELLSYNVVKIDDSATIMTGKPEKPEWYRITTLGGKQGFVNAKYVRSPIAYRAGFEKKRGIWKMVTFIAGD